MSFSYTQWTTIVVRIPIPEDSVHAKQRDRAKQRISEVCRRNRGIRVGEFRGILHRVFTVYHTEGVGTTESKFRTRQWVVFIRQANGVSTETAAVGCWPAVRNESRTVRRLNTHRRSSQRRRRQLYWEWDPTGDSARR